ncbi:MAG: S-methyl-5-thioribose-1-phosphate isomerase [Actinobacteria bacterium]|nr:S-methyl-5-thioribose-1-phosphate isomerase [Actinomycetota bacterium]
MISSEVRTIEWQNGNVIMIDQRLLPTVETYVTCRTWEEVADAIRTMIIRGAPAIGVAAAMGVAVAARSVASGSSLAFREILQAATKGLLATRPTAYNLAWAVREMEAIWRSSVGSPKEVAFALERRAIEIMREDVNSCRRIGEYGADVIVGRPAAGSRPAAAPVFSVPLTFQGGPVVLTHCNAGALATAGYGTALGVIRSVYAREPRLRVLADETRPLLQGTRLTAWELQRDGIPFELITDGMAGFFLSQGDVSHVVVGADRIAANGDTANKIGTYGLSVVAREHNVPFIIAAPFSTIDLSLANGGLIPIEERAQDEVTTLSGRMMAPAGATARNPAFDVTPATNISAIITDRGVAYPPFAHSLLHLAEQEGGTECGQ